MEKQHYSITINAVPEKVWDVLWNDGTYTKWTAPFSEGSKAITDWQEGSRVLFVDAGGKDGMVSTIASKKPNEYMSFRHLGYMQNGVEDFDSPQVKQWAGAEENYTLKRANGQTELTVDIDIAEEHAESFRDMWPKAMQKIKEISEQK